MEIRYSKDSKSDRYAARNRYMSLVNLGEAEKDVEKADLHTLICLAVTRQRRNL